MGFLDHASYLAAGSWMSGTVAPRGPGYLLIHSPPHSSPVFARGIAGSSTPRGAESLDLVNKVELDIFPALGHVCYWKCMYFPSSRCRTFTSCHWYALRPPLYVACIIKHVGLVPIITRSMSADMQGTCVRQTRRETLHGVGGARKAAWRLHGKAGSERHRICSFRTVSLIRTRHTPFRAAAHGARFTSILRRVYTWAHEAARPASSS